MRPERLITGYHAVFNINLFCRMKIVSFNKPNVKLTLAPGSGMTCAASGGSITMNGRWHYEIHKYVNYADKKY